MSPSSISDICVTIVIVVLCLSIAAVKVARAWAAHKTEVAKYEAKRALKEKSNVR